MSQYHANMSLQCRPLYTPLLYSKTGVYKGIHFFSSPEPKDTHGSGVRPTVGVRRPITFSNVFSSETAWPIKAKFYVEPPWEGGTKVCINGPGHMTKMATMPIYGKNLKKIFFSRTGSPMILKLSM